MENISHVCIKCKANYFDNEVDDYYCKKCKEEKDKIAKEIDSKIASKVSKRQMKTDLQIYDEIAKARGSRFVNIKDLGITL